MKINNKENKTYVVLGTPHSSTSFIAKALNDQGVVMTLTDDKYFKKHYQDIDFVLLNRKILKSSGGNWRNPPKKIKAGFSKKIRGLIEKRKNFKFWGWKDPANSLFVEQYLKYLKGDVYLVCVFRKPDKLVKSYKGKEAGKITREFVDRYNKQIIKSIKKFCDL